MDCKPTCSQLLPTTQQPCNILDQDHSLTNSPNNFQIKQELQSDNEEDNPAQMNSCPAPPATKKHFKTEESEYLPIIESVESLSEVAVKQKQDGGHSQPKGLPTPSPQHFGHQVTGVEAVDNRLGKIEKENAEQFTNNHTIVKEEMERYDDSKFDRVYQPVNTCDGNAGNETSAIITSVQSEENVEGVTDIGGRRSNMEESDEDLKMTVEEGEVFCEKRGNWLSKVVEKEDADSPDHEICNDDLHDQKDAVQGKLQGQQELREDLSFGVMTVNENKEEEDGGISERKTRELSSKDKKSEKQPSNLCADNSLGTKDSDSNPSSLESSPGHNITKKARHQCEVCGYSAKYKSRLTVHMHVHTQEKTYVCDICNKSFRQKGQLQRHKRTLHSGKLTAITADNLLGTKSCNSNPSSVESSRGHHKKNRATYQCDVCGYSTKKKSRLTAHMPVHTKEKPFVCDICNKRFARKQSLQHHKRLHNGDKQLFQCDICQKSFTQKGSLQHHKTMHSGDKKFKCDICGRRFSTKAHLKKHMIAHRGMRSIITHTGMKLQAEIFYKSTPATPHDNT